MQRFFVFLRSGFRRRASRKTWTSSPSEWAAKVDITPAQRDLPPGYEGIFDHLYSRAIVLENGRARAALITVDIGVIFEDVWEAVTRKLETELGIPAENVLLTATHTPARRFSYGPI